MMLRTATAGRSVSWTKAAFDRPSNVTGAEVKAFRCIAPPVIGFRIAVRDLPARLDVLQRDEPDSSRGGGLAGALRPAAINGPSAEDSGEHRFERPAVDHRRFFVLLVSAGQDPPRDRDDELLRPRRVLTRQEFGQRR